MFKHYKTFDLFMLGCIDVNSDGLAIRNSALRQFIVLCMQANMRRQSDTSSLPWLPCHEAGMRLRSSFDLAAYFNALKFQNSQGKPQSVIHKIAH